MQAMHVLQIFLAWICYVYTIFDATVEAFLPTIDVLSHCSPPISQSSPPSIIQQGSLLLSSSQVKAEPPFSLKGFQKDKVVRVLDATTVKLEKTGLVKLAGVRMPTPGSSNFQFPDCLSYTPAYKLRQFIPSKTKVLVRIADSKNSNALPAVILREEDSLFVNRELIRLGFGKVPKSIPSDFQTYLDHEDLRSLQKQAETDGIGIFKRCDEASMTSAPEAQFEPLEFTVETVWGDDGGKLVTRQRSDVDVQPDNPGDIRGKILLLCENCFYGVVFSQTFSIGCSDFSTYEDALRWYEKFFPYYGDVSKLDRDGDGVPCPGLPHTTVAEKYRMKVPTKVKQLSSPPRE